VSDRSYDYIDDILPEEPNGELVHWMHTKPLALTSLGPAALALAGFAAGLAVAAGAFALVRTLQAEAVATASRKDRRVRR